MFWNCDRCKKQVSGSYLCVDCGYNYQGTKGLTQEMNDNKGFEGFFLMPNSYKKVTSEDIDKTVIQINDPDDPRLNTKNKTFFVKH